MTAPGLADFLAGGSRRSAPRGVRGTETDWLALATVALPEGSLWAGDPQVIDAEDGLSIDVAPGDYRVEVKGLDVDGFRTVSRLRVVRRDVPAPARGDVIGETGTDSGQIAVCDIAAFGAAVGTDADLVERAVRDVGKAPFGTLVIAGIDVAFCMTGSDGGGPVHALLDGASVVGIELPFVDTMHAYR